MLPQIKLPSSWFPVNSIWSSPSPNSAYKRNIHTAHMVQLMDYILIQSGYNLKFMNSHNWSRQLFMNFSLRKFQFSLSDGRNAYSLWFVEVKYYWIINNFPKVYDWFYFTDLFTFVYCRAIFFIKTVKKVNNNKFIILIAIHIVS